MANVTHSDKRWLLSGERLLKLREGQGLTQEELADKLPLDSRGRKRSEKTIGRFERGERPISSEYAIMLSKVLNCLPQYLLLESDFKTAEEQFSYSLDKMEEGAKVLHSLIKGIASNYDYEIKYLRQNDAPNNISLSCDCYAIVENGMIVACISLEEYSQLRAEIAHYSAYLFGNLLGKAKSRTIQPFAFPGT